MLLLCVTFALLTVGFVLPCLLDIATTPRHLFDLPSKGTWLAVAAGFWVFGSAVWLIVGRREVQMRRHWEDMTGMWGADGGRGAGHPARPLAKEYPFGSTRRARQAATAAVRFVAPDDNPDFLLELDRRIQRWREGA